MKTVSLRAYSIGGSGKQKQRAHHPDRARNVQEHNRAQGTVRRRKKKAAFSVAVDQGTKQQLRMWTHGLRQKIQRKNLPLRFDERRTRTH